MTRDINGQVVYSRRWSNKYLLVGGCLLLNAMACSGGEATGSEATGSETTTSDATTSEATAQPEQEPEQEQEQPSEEYSPYLASGQSDEGDLFGEVVALSANGNTLVVGARREDSSATNVDGNGRDNGAEQAGAAYVYTRREGIWTLQTYLKGSQLQAHHEFGTSVAISGDGSTIAVAAQLSSLAFVAAPEAPDAQVYVFHRDADTWVERAIVTPEVSDQGDGFGFSLALNDDGTTLVAGAPAEQSGASGIDGDAADNSVTLAGAAYVFARSGDTWSQQAYLKSNNPQYLTGFGLHLAIDGSGNRVAVAAQGEPASDPETGDVLATAGAVYVFERTGTTWQLGGKLQAAYVGSDGNFGKQVALSRNGKVLAAVSWDQSHEGEAQALFDAPYDSLNVFERDGDSWLLRARVRDVEKTALDGCMAISDDGSLILTSDTVADTTARDTGLGYSFLRTGNDWAYSEWFRPINPQSSDTFGASCAVSGDGATIVFGAPGTRASLASNIDAPANDSAAQTGGVFVY
jgi:hypothetical protein